MSVTVPAGLSRPVFEAHTFLDWMYWAALAPDLHVDHRDFIQKQRAVQFPVPDFAAVGGQLAREGYFRFAPERWELDFAPLVRLIDRLDALGLPIVFAFAYDEAWAVFHRLNGLIGQILGPGFLRLPAFWAWRIDPARGDSGWKPHRDRGYTSLFPDGSPQCLTVWVPLTEATVDNGCIHVVPKHRDPTYGTPDDNKYLHNPTDVRPLPAPAGTVLGWNQALLHWGGRASAGRPRISAAIEYQSGAIPPQLQPLMPPHEFPNFAQRMVLIAQQMLQYKHMHPLAPDVEAAATRVLGGQR